MAIDDASSPQQIGNQDSFELSIGGLIGQTIILWFRKFPQYFTIIIALGLLSVVIQVIVLISFFGFFGLGYLQFIGTSPFDSVFSLILTPVPFTLTELTVVAFLTIVSMVIYSIVAGAVIRYALVDYEQPGKAEIGESFSYATSRAPTLIGSQLIVSFILIGAASIIFVVALFDYLISFVLFFLVLYLAVKLTPSTAIVIAEDDRSAISAVRESWRLTGGVFWHVFLAQLLFGIVLIVLEILFGSVSSIMATILLNNTELGLVFGTIITSLILSPVNYIYLGVLYKDLNSRQVRDGINR